MQSELSGSRTVPSSSQTDPNSSLRNSHNGSNEAKKNLDFVKENEEIGNAASENGENEHHEKKGKQKTMQKAIHEVISYLRVIINIWMVILSKDLIKRVAKKLFSQPVYLCLFTFPISFLLGIVPFFIIFMQVLELKRNLSFQQKKK